jgi:uroporphyrinogen decarboxylase
MRQAGRYLPEYRDLRARAGSFLSLCYDSKLASEVTLQPLRRFDLDAAIIFADILVVPHAMGVDLRFEEGEGPVLETVTSLERVARLGSINDQPQVAAVCDSLGRVKRVLPDEVALIGFCGGPWTVASYLVEGGSSLERRRARLAAYREEEWFCRLIERLVEESVSYLALQVRAGAQVLQIFESWAGDLSGELYERWVLKPLSDVVSRVRESSRGVPVIVFARGSGMEHGRIARETGCQAVGVETGMSLKALMPLLPDGCALQGNLDPVALLAGTRAVRRSVERVVSEVPKERHIFNLGHGILPETPPEAVTEALAALRAHDGAP